MLAPFTRSRALRALTGSAARSLARSRERPPVARSAAAGTVRPPVHAPPASAPLWRALAAVSPPSAAAGAPAGCQRGASGRPGALCGVLARLTRAHPCTRHTFLLRPPGAHVAAAHGSACGRVHGLWTPHTGTILARAGALVVPFGTCTLSYSQFTKTAGAHTVLLGRVVRSRT